MLTQESLSQFTGSQQYYRHWTRKMFFTEGVYFLANEGQAHWLIDAIASYQGTNKITSNPMLRDIQFWKLTVKNGKGVLTCVEDSGRKPVIKQEIPFTDFPLENVEIWVERGGIPADNEDGWEEGMVALLPSEH